MWHAQIALCALYIIRRVSPPTQAYEQPTVLDGGSGVCGRGTAAKMVESARRADLSLSSGLSSALRFASLCSLFWGGGIPAAKLGTFSPWGTVI